MKKGDTLIEVMLAVGIFSMVAVAVVAVMSNGTAGAQTSLETTLAREEIDAQAEALRFIQSAYISDQDNDGKYAILWRKITASAMELKNDDSDAEIVQYAPESCPSLYEGIIASQNAFIINTRYLGTYSNITSKPSDAEVNKAVPFVTEQPARFKEATTYPHLIYGSSASESSSEDKSKLFSGTTFTNFLHADGIYIIAVKDTGTSIISGIDKNAETAPAFYDFYIRTCWYGVGDQTPSTISTVIRLYDPDAIGD